MVVYTFGQCWEIHSFIHSFENHGNVAECVRKLRTDFRRREAPSAPYVREKPKTVRTPVNTAAVAESVCEAPSTSIHHHSQQLNISETSFRRLLHIGLDVIQSSIVGSGVKTN